MAATCRDARARSALAEAGCARASSVTYRVRRAKVIAMDSRSQHFSSENGDGIFADLERDNWHGTIGGLLGRPARTICRGLVRRRLADCFYCPKAEQRLDHERRRRVVGGCSYHRFPHDHLFHRHWSPDQIPQGLRPLKSDYPAHRVSHESFCAAVYAQPSGRLKLSAVKAPWHARRMRGHLRTALAGTTKTSEAPRIITGSEEVEARPIPVGWRHGLITRVFHHSSVYACRAHDPLRISLEDFGKGRRGSARQLHPGRQNGSAPAWAGA